MQLQEDDDELQLAALIVEHSDQLFLEVDQMPSAMQQATQQKIRQ